MTPPRLLLVCFLAWICAASVSAEEASSDVIEGVRQNFAALTKELDDNLAYLAELEGSGSSDSPSTQSTTDASDPGTTESTGGSVGTTELTTDDGASTTPSGSPASPGTVITTTGGSTVEPPSTISNEPSSDTSPTVTAGPGGSTSAGPIGSTTVISVTTTTTQAPTTTTLPPTTAEPWEYFYLDCDNTTHTCVYTIDAPQLSASEYNGEVDKYNTDKNVYLNASARTYDILEKFVADGVVQNLTNLEDLVASLERNITELVNLIETMENETNDAAAYITSANYALNDSRGGVFSNKDSCYAQTCSRATPKPTTTTTTPRPTTPDLCAATHTTCDGAGYKGVCNIINSQPICQCPGNLDGKNNCAQASCYSDRIGVYDGTAPGPFWTPNYTESNPLTYAKNLNCVWKISASSGKVLKVTSKAFSLDSTSSITVNSKKIPYTLDNTKAQTFLDKYVTGQPYVTITFKSGSAISGAHFINWEFDNHEA